MARHAGAAVKQTIQLATLQNCTQIPKIDCEIVTYECTKTTLKPFKTKKLLEELDKIIDNNDLQFVEHNVKETIEGDKISIIFVSNMLAAGDPASALYVRWSPPTVITRCGSDFSGR